MIERGLNRARIRTKAHQRHLLDDIEQTDGGNDGSFRVIIEAFQHQLISRHGQHGGQHRCDQDRGHEPRSRESKCGVGPHRISNPPGQHSTDHEKFAMRDIDHAHDPENQRQAERHQCKHRRGDEAFQQP